MPVISVIIPVYNTAPYLGQCLDSVLSQTFGDIEVITVDDGSTDGSTDILLDYAERDGRVKIINQKNQHAGAARNAGLSAAAGEYVIFWDSDDCFKETALQEMYARVQETDADICICNAQDFDSESGELLYHNYLRSPLPEAEVFNIGSFPKYFFTFTSPNTWNKLVRRSLFTENGIEFDSLQHINDVTGTFLAMASAKRIVLLNKRLVYYRVNRSRSLMSTYGEQTDAVFSAYSNLKSELERRGLLQGDDSRQSFNNKVWDIFVFTARYCNSSAAFLDYAERLKGEWLPAFQMENLTADYFYNEDRGRQYEYLLSHTAGDFLFMLFCFQSDLSKKRNQKIRQFKAENKTLAKKNEKAAARTEKLSAKLDKKNEKIQALREKLSVKDQRIAELKDKLQAQKTKAAERQAELKNAQKELARRTGEAEKQNAELKRQSAELERRGAEIKRRDALLGRRLVRLALKISNFFTKIKKGLKNGR